MIDILQQHFYCKKTNIKKIIYKNKQITLKKIANNVKMKNTRKRFLKMIGCPRNTINYKK